jgi:hypothetical protein
MPRYILCNIVLLPLAAFFCIEVYNITPMKRVIFFFDGFNFYYGLRE